MILAVEIVALLFMITILFIGIWGFVLMIKIYNQMKYRNYILEKLSQNVYSISSKISFGDKTAPSSDDQSEDVQDSTLSNITKLMK